ncbi:MAG: LLM class flavin-dependent oxidoreductase [Actinophytocola sp.]|uniref:LLM class flavin-dependent oxidoreductase n=1 Tax=Actinophytocola sp. TaxID=1872138 RepID=UPI0013266071|nr:LLM class flavin-dependent oxidoreductase [Actinophytocola sp.]MPZ85508.1 LLM class flavin-dependent oxidoreductase [Actinophytocola sp.]
MRVGITLPATGNPGAFARHVEDIGLDSVWTGDHLIAVAPKLDSTLLLATAAATTTRIGLGFGVLILALRPVAWAAKQVATLQHLSGDRVLLGIGTGGEVHGDEGWRAAGVPFAERGPRTDAALSVLPDLIAGKPTELDGDSGHSGDSGDRGGPVRLAPGATMPPVLIGDGPQALRRAARLGHGWYPAFLPPAALAAGVRELAERAEAHGHPTPGVTAQVSVGLGDVPTEVVDAQVRGLTAYGMSEAVARLSLVTGGPAAAADRLAALAAAGAERIVGLPFADDNHRQAELLAEAVRLAG